MLFNEPKLLKSVFADAGDAPGKCFSALQRAEIAEIQQKPRFFVRQIAGFSALQRAEIAEILPQFVVLRRVLRFSALQRAEIAEIRLSRASPRRRCACFSALQRAEIAEMFLPDARILKITCFSALQRAEIAEMLTKAGLSFDDVSFSALQRAEIAEMARPLGRPYAWDNVSVLFNEPKLLKWARKKKSAPVAHWFQCSSTSRNC